MQNNLNISDSCIVLDDNFTGYGIKSFYIPLHYQDSLDYVLIPQGFCKDRTQRMAQEIVESFGNYPITVLCVLKGAYRFFTELLKEMEVFQRQPIKMEFIRLKSYQNTKSTGKVEIRGLDEGLQSLKNKNVLIVEDIVDTGRTIMTALEMLNNSEYKPSKVKVASLLLKRMPEATGYRPDYVGFEVPDRFVVGCGFDYNEMFRDLNHVCVINEFGKKKYSISVET